jgi:hypothetical protein
VDDPYKRANVGVQAMKGLGLWSPDESNAVSVLVANIPDDLKALIMSPEFDPPQDADNKQNFQHLLADLQPEMGTGIPVDVKARCRTGAF